MQKTSLPSPKKEYAANFGTLKGGLNLFDPSYRLKSDESPDMLNLLWRDGMLRSRKGQEYLSNSIMGTAYAAYPKLWHGYAFAHIGTAIYCFNVLGSSHTPQILCSAVPLVRGTFFLFGDQLYYKTRGLYKVFTAMNAKDVRRKTPVTRKTRTKTRKTGKSYKCGCGCKGGCK